MMLDKNTITDKMFEDAKDIWDKLKTGDFILEMAAGTLSEERYRTYMLQDYAYLKYYLKVLTAGYNNAETDEEREYLKSHMDEIHEEIERVHVPAMRRLNISDDDIDSLIVFDEVKIYSEYMLDVAKGGGFVDCICAILACSWSYEYLCEELIKSGSVDFDSKYASWFSSYSSKEYKKSNSGLIEKVNEYASGLSDEKIQALIEVFKKCSVFELDFWNAL